MKIQRQRFLSTSVQPIRLAFVFFFLVFEDISSLIEKASSVLKTIQDSQVFNPLWGFHFGNSPYGFWPAL